MVRIQINEKSTAPPTPVELEQVISLTQNDADAPSAFGDDDALLSVTAEAFEVRSLDKSSNTGGSSNSKAITETLKSSELRSTGGKEPSILSERYGSSIENSDRKLRLDSIKLIARDKDISALKECFHQLVNGGEKDHQSSSKAANNTAKRWNKEIVFLSGQSGVGKTSVVNALEKDVVKLDGSLFVTGKFDMTKSDMPYSGIADALNEAFRKVQGTKSESKISHAIKAEVSGDEIQLMSHLIPSLKSMLVEHTTTNSPTDPDFDELENGLERLKIAFRVLIRVLCQEHAFFVLFLDDLHWADIASLQVLDSLISDRQNENSLMIVGAYRSDEVDENSLLHNKILALQEKKDDCEFTITEIDIFPFDVGDIRQIIEIAMESSESDDRIEPLAELCLKRTLGNPFFVIEFVKMLEMEGLLMYDKSLHKWNWDILTIEDTTMSTANVVVLLQERIRKMPTQVQIVLQYAAYLGSTFKEATLNLIWTTYGTMMKLTLGNKDHLPKILDQIIEESFFEKCGVNSLRWVHDKVQEAVLDFAGSACASLQLDIGTTLYYCLNEEELDDDLFTVADLINNGNVEKRPKFAYLNMRAAKKARGISAFQSAARYATHAMELLTEKRWTENRQLTLEIYIMTAEMEMILGNVAIAERYREDILKHGNFSVMETIPLKLSKAKSLGEMTLQFDDAVNYSLSVLKELGCNLILSRRLVPAQTIMKLYRTVRKVKNVKDDFYVGVGRMSEPKQRAIASMVTCIKNDAFNSGDIMLAMICVFKLVDITLKYGLSEFSGCAFASLGTTVVIVMQDFALASRILNLASSIQKEFGKTRTSELIYNIVVFGRAWIDPMRKWNDRLREGYTMGIRSGEMEYALWNVITTVIFIPYASGDPLRPIIAECSRILAQAEDIQRSGPILTIRVFWQMMLNIQNGSMELEGVVFSKAKDNNQSNIHLATIHLAEGELLLFNGDYEAATERAIANGGMFEEYVPSFFLIMSETFNQGVALYAMARKHKKRLYIKKANSIRKRVAKWMKAGNPNVEHFHLFLKAEHEALEKKYDNADENYRKAITVAISGGHLSYIALFNERYADFLLNDRSLKAKSLQRMKEAAQYFEEWGALTRAKCMVLNEEEERTQESSYASHPSQRSSISRNKIVTHGKDPYI